MILKFGDKKLEISEEHLESIISRRSGKQLERLRFEHMIRGEEANNEFLNLLSEAKHIGLESIDTSGFSKRYEITNNSYIYSGHSISDNTIFNHIIELQEEDLKIVALIVSGYEFSPYAYEESYIDEAIFIQAKVQLTGTQFTRIKEIMNGPKYFTVIRSGLSEKALTMRFDTMRWSNHLDSIKHEINLVDIAYDQNHEDNNATDQQNDSNVIQKALAYIESYQNELTDLLINKQMITVDEAREAKRRAENKKIDMLHEFQRVDDIDQ